MTYNVNLHTRKPS